LTSPFDKGGLRGILNLSEKLVMLIYDKNVKKLSPFSSFPHALSGNPALAWNDNKTGTT